MVEPTANKRIAKNSIFLLLRMILLTLVSLYTSRVVLHSLGASDYGLYNVVGGIVVMFVFLNNAMMNATQRYITFELGKENFSKLNRIFCISINIHVLISLLVFLLVETVGIWFLYNKLVIPEGRLNAAFWTLQFSAIATVVTIISVPYNALIVAHEKMAAFAYISIVDALFKLIVAYLISVTSHDKLILYSFLLLLISVFDRIIYNIYCRKKFEESKYRYIKDNKLFREMFAFAGWSMIGNLAYVGATEGLNIMLNMFFNPVVNAARAIAVQIQGVIINFSSNVENAIKPQITKSYAQESNERLFTLSYASARFTFFALLLVSLPIMIEAKEILTLWLKDVPEHTVRFVQLILLCTLVDVLSNPMLTIAQASAKIKKYQTIVGLIYLLVVPLSYLALVLWRVPEFVFVVNLLVFLVLQIVKMFIVCPIVKMPIRGYAKMVYLRSFGVLLFCGIISYLPILLMTEGLMRLGIVLLFSIVSMTVGIYTIGLNSNERVFVKRKVVDIVRNYKPTNLRNGGGKYDINKVKLFKSILPILIVIHHCSLMQFIPSFFSRFGIPLVSCFFLMSGYGLMTSYLSKGEEYLKTFWKHRFVLLLVPYMMAMGLWCIYLYLSSSSVEFSAYFEENIVGSWLPYSWFVWVLMLAYVAFYLIFKMDIRLSIKVFSFAFLMVLYFLLCKCFLDPKYEYWYASSYSIIIGVLWKFYEESLIKYMRKLRVLVCALCFSVCAYWLFNRISEDFSQLFVCFAFVLCAYILPDFKPNMIIKHLSKISYEVYLLQSIPIFFVSKYVDVKGWLIVGVILLVDIFLASLLNILFNRIKVILYGK